MYLFIILLLVIIIAKFKKKQNGKKNSSIEQTIVENSINDYEEKYKKVENSINNYTEKYKKVDYLLTKNELKFYRILKQITDKLGYSIFCQVSLYQIVNSKDFKDFNKIKSKSIDFVITQENCKILICIELDDFTHERQKRIERDNFINKLFKDLGIKLLRIPVQNFYNIEELETKIKESL